MDGNAEAGARRTGCFPALGINNQRTMRHERNRGALMLLLACRKPDYLPLKDSQE